MPNPAPETEDDSEDDADDEDAPEPSKYPPEVDDDEGAPDYDNDGCELFHDEKGHAYIDGARGPMEPG